MKKIKLNAFNDLNKNNILYDGEIIDVLNYNYQLLYQLLRTNIFIQFNLLRHELDDYI